MKLMKIKTTGLRKIGKVTLWVLVVFLILCGIKTVLSQSSEGKLQSMLSKSQTSAQLREKTKIGATAFAESFIYDYYTFSGQLNSNYSDRVKSYLAKGLEVKNPSAGETAAETISARTINVKFDSKDVTRLDVDILAKIKYTQLMGEKAGTNSESNIYIRVPVATQNGDRFAIESLPMIIPSYDKAAAENAEGYSIAEVDRDTKDEIQVVLESFFKAYYEGTDNEVSYYVSGDSNIKKSLAGLITFNKIDQISVVMDEQNGGYLSDVLLTVTDHGQPLQQRLFLKLEKEKGKYYIQKISTRTI